MTRLLVVTLLLAAVALALKLRSRNTTTTRAIKVTSRITINRGSMIAVVEVDGRRLLVGAAANQVNLLAELADAPPAAEPTATPDPSPIPGALARLGSLRPRPSDSSTSTSLMEKARRMTTRSVEPRLRLPGSLPGQTGGPT
jgi:flagellar biogenesis protein FliO